MQPGLIPVLNERITVSPGPNRVTVSLPDLHALRVEGAASLTVRCTSDEQTPRAGWVTGGLSRVVNLRGLVTGTWELEADGKTRTVQLPEDAGKTIRFDE